MFFAYYAFSPSPSRFPGRAVSLPSAFWRVIRLRNSVGASHFGVSIPEMNRLMLYYSEKNFETLLNFVRINRACELLASTEKYVIDVAFEVGCRGR